VLGLVLSIVAAIFLVTGWRAPRAVRDALTPATPHERYLSGLENAGLSDTALAREWRDSSLSVLARPTPVATPFTEELFLDPVTPRAAAYAVTVRRGQRLEIEATLQGDASARVFVDVFEAGTEAGGTARARASAADGESRAAYEPERDGRVIVRVQPELLRGGRLRVTSRLTATLLFPVPGVTPAALRSIFGDPRDAGQRRHEGVDIFAARGTPVVAASDGIVTSVGESNLGGRVVWLWNATRGHAQYYAHLSEQLVTSGQLVRRGDVIGRIGNTGNARTTPPHLHFGIYARSGAIDPAPFVLPLPGAGAAPSTASIEHLGAWARVTSTRGTLREGPSPGAPELTVLPRNTAVRVAGAVDRWVRVALPDAGEGFVPLATLALAPAPLRRVRVTADTAVRTRPEADAPMRTLIPPPGRLSVLGTFGGHALVQTESGERGWARL
jgi:murein DD-endopeptidase MepM/ murein hydrolase activator NlpD